jgi:hypothetical protein
MNRVLVTLAVGAGIGAAIGAGVTFTLVTERSIGAPGADLEFDAGRFAREPDRAAYAAVSTDDRAASYRRAAAAGRSDIQALVTDAAAERPSARRDAELEALLGRFAELDARAAVEVARRLRLGTELVAPLYGSWHEADPDAALAGLRAIEDPGEAAAIGLAIVSRREGASALARVVAALPRDPAASSLPLLRAPLGPFGAPAQRAALPGSPALERFGAGWARRDLEAALAHVDDIDDGELRATFHGAVLREWGYIDAAGTLDYLSGLDPDVLTQVVLSGGMRELSRADPRRALDLAARLTDDARFALQQDALRQLAEDDALAALRYVQGLSAGRDSQQLRQVVAVFYGEQHPDAALAWARAIEGQPGLMAAVLNGIAMTDADRAFALAVALPPAERGAALSTLVRNAQSGEELAAMGERVLALRDPRLEDLGLQTLLQGWGAREPQQALEWLLGNLERVPPEAAPGIARMFASRNPAVAAAELERIPSALRVDWFAGVAQGYAQADPLEGARWLAQFRGEPGYEDAVAALVPALARKDGAAAVRLLETVADSGPQVFEEVAMGVVEQWSQQNPLAAAQWVGGIENKQVRSVALPTLAGRWAAEDFRAARDWVLGLPSGLERDAALTRMIFSVANADAVADRAVTEAFSGDAARQQAILHIVNPVARTDPARARVLLAQYLPDPGQRERVEQLLESTQREPPSMPNPGRDLVRTPPPGIGLRPALN